MMVIGAEDLFLVSQSQAVVVRAQQGWHRLRVAFEELRLQYCAQVNNGIDVLTRTGAAQQGGVEPLAHGKADCPRLVAAIACLRQGS